MERQKNKGFIVQYVPLQIIVIIMASHYCNANIHQQIDQNSVTLLASKLTLLHRRWR